MRNSVQQFSACSLVKIRCVSEPTSSPHC